MDEIIKKVTMRKGYKMGQEETKVLCYPDDAMLLAEN
jgi:hypothetical protein